MNTMNFQTPEERIKQIRENKYAENERIQAPLHLKAKYIVDVWNEILKYNSHHCNPLTLIVKAGQILFINNKIDLVVINNYLFFCLFLI